MDLDKASVSSPIGTVYQVQPEAMLYRVGVSYHFN